MMKIELSEYDVDIITKLLESRIKRFDEYLNEIGESNAYWEYEMMRDDYKELLSRLKGEH